MIEARGLIKRFGDQVALRGVTLTAGAGEVVGLVGPNGAGKTTTIRILATLLAPDAGNATVAGHDVVEEAREVQAVVGFMPESFGLYDDLSVQEYLEVFARIYRLRPPLRSRRVEQVMELLDLAGKREDRCEVLSRGVRQRLYLAKTLLHDPAVLLLDEPAAGLDPRARVELRELLRELAAQGKAVLVSSHILRELEEVATHVAVIERGRVVYHGSLGDLEQARRGALRIRAVFLDEEAARRAAELLGGEEGVTEVEREGAALSLSFVGGADRVPGLHRAIAAAGLPLYTFDVERSGLEGLFLSVTQGVVS